MLGNVPEVELFSMSTTTITRRHSLRIPAQPPPTPIPPSLVHPAMRTSNGCRTPSLLLKEEQQMPKDLASIAKAVSFVDHGQLTHGVATPLSPPPQLQIDQIVQ